MSEEQQAHFMDETVPGTRRQMQEAQQFVKERSLQDWLRDQNINKGLAPTADNVYRKWRHLQRSLSPARMADVAPGERKTRSRVQWVRRWSRRFALARGRFKVGSRLPLPLAREKVRYCTQKLPKKYCAAFHKLVHTPPRHGSKNSAHFPGPKTGPHTESAKKTRSKNRSQNRFHFWEIFFL